MSDPNYERDTDLIIQVVSAKNARDKAAEQESFDMAISTEAAKYRYHQKQVRKRFHALNQLSMVATGALSTLTVLLCLGNCSWYSLVYMIATCTTWSFGRWCHTKSKRKCSDV